MPKELGAIRDESGTTITIRVYEIETMSRRSFLKRSALLTATAFSGVAAHRAAQAQTGSAWPEPFVMGGHAQPGTSFSRGLDT